MLKPSLADRLYINGLVICNTDAEDDVDTDRYNEFTEYDFVYTRLEKNLEKVVEMEKKDFFEKYAGKYRLVKFIIGGGDASDRYIEGWKDKSFYTYFEITEEGKFLMKAHAGGKEKVYEYFVDAQEMKYYLKPNHSGQGTSFRIENGVITEESDNHLMVYELTDELD